MTMVSSHKGQPRYEVVSGISRALPAHLLDARKWYDSLNMRFRRGTIRQVEVWADQLNSVGEGGPQVHHCTAILAVPHDTDTARVIGLFEDIAVDIRNLTSTPVTIAEFQYPQLDSHFLRWGVVADRTGAYFINPCNPVYKYDTETIGVLSDEDDKYYGHFIDIFYDHLVVANLSLNGLSYTYRVAYSDLSNFGVFAVTTTNEADFKELNSANLVTSPLGITGLKTLGEVCVVYTPNAIFNMRYVGFDNGVMSFNEQVTGVGCQYPHTVARINRLHYFIGKDDFYTYDGVSVQSFGADIREYFFADVAVTDSLVRQFWVYVDTDLQEITWHYLTAAGVIKAVTYNYQENSWFPHETPLRYSRLKGRYTMYKSIDELSGDITTLGTTDIDDLGVHVTQTFDLIGVSTGGVFQSPQAFGVAPPTLTQTANPTTAPYLETGDILYGDPISVKELDTMLIDAAYSTYCDGVQVEISTRDHLGDAIVWNKVGVWTTGLTQRRFCPPGLRTKGRVFRFRFTFLLPTAVAGTYVSGAQFYGFVDNLYRELQEQ